MPIVPLPQFEADLAEQDRETYEKLKPPTSVVVRFGILKLVGEFPFQLDVKPGCGTKFVLRTHRGTEIGEMLTSTCPNSGCSKSVSRKEMLEYIENSGGKDYPFFSMQGKVLRVATIEDLNQQTKIDEMRPQMVRQARAISERMKLPLKMVDAEPILGGEKITFYFLSEERIDFRELVQELAGIHHTRIELRQVGARDEARLTADYEKCGQHCCCKQFLKVLKPVSMKAAKTQKATLDPLKISGRCGRLLCCLRYEEQTYDELRARLPKKRTRVNTEHGEGYVIDSQILTQLVLVQLEAKEEQVAVPLEELTILGPGGGGPPQAPKAAPPREPRPERGPRQGESRDRAATSKSTEERPAADDLAPDGDTDVDAPDLTSPTREARPPEPPAKRPRDDRSPRGDRGPASKGGDARPRPGQPQGQQPQGDRPKPPSQPPQSRPPAGPPRDELDEIMDMLEGGENTPSDPKQQGRPEDRSGGGGKRRRRRRRGGGSGPEGGPPPAGDRPPATDA
ncbi:MAG: hypothetical protein K2W85_15515 [Phycisphaerales bacterium]|nr:hypothetical protein [Phycisphaerales bacterium]